MSYHDEWASKFGKIPTCRELNEVNRACDAFLDRRGIERKPYREVNANQAAARRRRHDK